MLVIVRIYENLVVRISVKINNGTRANGRARSGGTAATQDARWCWTGFRRSNHPDMMGPSPVIGAHLPALNRNKGGHSGAARHKSVHRARAVALEVGNVALAVVDAGGGGRRPRRSPRPSVVALPRCSRVQTQAAPAGLPRRRTGAARRRRPSPTQPGATRAPRRRARLQAPWHRRRAATTAADAESPAMP